jgi:YD repeat-containing protein
VLDNQVLSQEGIHDQSDLHTDTVKSRYQPHANRWLGEEQQNQSRTEVQYDAAGQPATLHSSTGRRQFEYPVAPLRRTGNGSILPNVHIF